MNSPQDLLEGHHLPVKKNLWQRWMSWSGSFFVISLLIHILLIGGATVLVVQVIQGKKEKLQFTARPPTPAAPAEHKVKPTKKTASTAPAITKRITSTAMNASVALPPIDLSSSAAPDLMSGVMSGMGAGGLGMGSGGAGAGMAAMPVAGLTAFGFKGLTTGGLVGHFYDLTHNPDKTPTEAAKQSTGSPAYYQALSEYFSKNWDEEVLKRYYCAHDTMLAVQMYMPCSGSSGAAKAFNVENEVKNPLWVIHYQGTVVAPFDGEFRFWASADDYMAIRFDGVPVLSSPGLRQYMPKEGLPFVVPKTTPPALNQLYQNAEKLKISTGIFLTPGSWIRVEKGKSYPIDIVIGDTGGLYQQILLIQERNPSTPYPTSTNDPSTTVLPLVQFRKDIPLPKYDPKLSGDYSRNPDFAPFSIIFPAK